MGLEPMTLRLKSDALPTELIGLAYKIIVIVK